MTNAIRLHGHGGPEVLSWEETEVPEPARGEVRVRQSAVGLNYIDTYHRTGLYPVETPHGLGLEAAGVVEAVGEGVSDLAVGDRVAYGAGPIGAYAEARCIPAGRVVPLPDAVDDETAAAAMLKGMTVRYLVRETFRVEPGMTVLWHAAAGGVGLIACQWLSSMGVTVIGTASTQEKRRLAEAHGCTHTVGYEADEVLTKVREVTGGKGVPVVYDGVGAETLDVSLEALAPRGLLATFGNASGPVSAFDLGRLSAGGSLYATRPTLMTYVAEDDALRANATEVLGMIASGRVRVPVNQRYALRDAAEAHRDLEARRTTGSTVLVP